MLYFDDSGLKTSETCYEINSKVKNKDWIFNNLRKHGNCFIGSSDKNLIPELQQRLKKNIKMRSFENGYILEVL
jgi:rRNA-processing protein FCF1